MTLRAAGRLTTARWRTPLGWAALSIGTGIVAVLLAGAQADSLPALIGTSVTRSGMDAAAVACIGVALLGVLLPLDGAALPGRAVRDLEHVQAASDRALVGLAGAWLGSVVLAVAFRAADAFRTPVSELGGTDALRWTTQLSAGRGLALAALCAAAVLGCATARLRDPGRVQVRVLLIAALLGILAPAVTGHAGSAADHQLAVLAIALHVGAAALWVGGLGAVLVFVARHRALLDAVLPRFSRLAGGLVVAVALTGVINAALRLESWAALFGTGYGLLVVAKTVGMVVVALLGGVARRRLAAGRTPVLRWAGVEVAVMAAALGVAAALTQTA